MTGKAFAFGPFQVLTGQRALLSGDDRVRLGSRALDLLVVLLEHAGTVVSNDELVRRVWPQSVVDESNLRVHISALRKALSDGTGRTYIENIPLRGYCFVAPVQTRQEDDANAIGGGTHAAHTVHGLPTLLARVVGRDGAIDTVVQLAGQRRLTTIVGPGGVGKTTVAVCAAQRLAAQFADGVWFVDLAPLSNAGLVAGAVASAMGLTLRDSSATPLIAGFLQGRRALLVLDNCEHVIAAVATLVEALHGSSAALRILATSREPLQAGGEWIYRLAPLGVPPAGPMPARDAMAYPAVQLFAERAMASADALTWSDADIAAAAAICRRLDGIPLALELAAARLDTLGVKQLAVLLRDRFSLLTQGRRAALPRHQTLKAALDWSYEALSPQDQRVLRRLAVFRGSFSLACVEAVVADAPADDALLAVSNLAGKSLLAVDIHREPVRYRMLEMTRAHALELADPAEIRSTSRRHAVHLRDVLARSQRDWSREPGGPWLDAYAPYLDDLRAALEWCFCVDGDATLGCELTALSSVLWFQLSLIAEYRPHVERAIAHAAAGPGVPPAIDLQLHAALTHVLAYLLGPSAPAHMALCARTLALAQALGDPSQQLQMLYRLWHADISRGDYLAATAWAEKFGLICERHGDQEDRVQMDRILTIGFHAIGRPALARFHVDRLLQHPVLQFRATERAGVLLDQRVMGLSFQAQLLWLQGFPIQAQAVADECVAEGERRGHALSVMFALALGACPVAFWSGAEPLMRRRLDMLQAHAAQHDIGLYGVWAQCYARAFAAIGGGTPPPAMRLAGGVPNEAQDDMLATLADGLASPQALARVSASDRRWCAPEVMRRQAAHLARSGTCAQAEAVHWLTRALALAREQEALSWELRCASDLAELQLRENQAAAARALLGPVYGRFTEGFDTADLRRAAAILAAT